MKDVVGNESSQIRIVFLLLLEIILPRISRKYFKQMFLESFFNMKDEATVQLLILYVRLFPLVRMKLDEFR